MIKLQGESLRFAQIFLIVAPAFILFGYNQSGMGGLDDFPAWVRQFPEIDTVNTTGAQKGHNSTIQGTVIASFMLGALSGSLATTWIGDTLGRRKTIFTGACIALVGQILECTAYSLAQLVVGRVILGWGIGILSATVPVWQSECALPEKRGRNVALTGMFIAFGFALTQWVNFGFYHIQGEAASWRGSLAIPALFCFIIMGSIFFLPESPHWLLRKNQTVAARQTLALLRLEDPSSPQITMEVQGIESSIEEFARQSLGLKDLFKIGGEDKLFYRFILCLALQFMQQMSGGTLISVYIPTIFETDLGLGASTAKILAACALTWKFLSCFLAFVTIDKLGRRMAFMISGGGMSACMVAMAVSNSFADNHAASIVSALFIFLYNTFLPIGFLGPNFLYPAEIAPVHLRVAMQAISMTNQWLWMFIVAMITPTALDNIGFYYYIVYAVIAGFIPPAIYLFYPETMNRTLEEIDGFFRDAPSIWGVVALSKNYVPRNDEVDDMEKMSVKEIENK